MKLKIIYTLLFVLRLNSFAQVSSSKDTIFKTEEIKVISNRIETDLFWSPTSVKVLNSEQLNSTNGERISDILKSFGNIFMKSYGNSASLNTISLNGLGAEHTLILIDGNKINSFQNSQTDLSAIPKDKIEKIEIMNNGASSIYGSNAIGGVVNLITVKSLSDKPSFRLSGSYGSYEQKKMSFDFMNSSGKLNYNIFYSFDNSNDDFKYFYDNGIAKIEKRRINNNYSANNLFLDLYYIISKKSNLRFNSNYLLQTRNLPGLEAGTPPTVAEQKDNNWNSNFLYEHKISENVSISSGLNYQDNLLKYKDILSNDFYKSRLISNNTLAILKYGNIKNTSGIELLYSDLNCTNYENTVSRKQYSLFTATEFDIKNKIKLFPSIRYDYINDINKNIFTGKIGINYKPFEKINLNIRSSFGNNFSAPTFNELYWINSGNKNLKPEKSVNFDAGLIFRLYFFFENTLEINYTNIKLEDKIVWKPAEQGLWKPFNIDKSESDVLSFDFKIKKNFNKDIIFGLYYSYTFNKSTKTSEDYPGDPSFGKQIFYIPVELSKINFEAKYKEFGFNLSYNFTGKRFSDFENLNKLPVIDLLDGNVNYTFKISKLYFNTKFEVNNILNEDYLIIPGYPMPLRNYKFNLNINY